MKAFTYTLLTFIAVCFLPLSGCESPEAVAEPRSGSDRVSPAPSYTGYAPVKASIMPLTEFVRAGGAEQASKLGAYVGLLDSFGSQIKAPAVFRFELYEHLQRSSEPKGKRVAIWPDIDLTDAPSNNSYWQDFLRAYNFSLDFEPKSNQDYVLQVTATCADGKRLSAEYVLRHGK
ncbi:MAG: hypothetical protein JSU70_05465 [Phycisphaerales bacterium]|nr:MAG: hypothetical protein JSU70_05465 [Phycisphaerales bacterium]